MKKLYIESAVVSIEANAFDGAELFNIKNILCVDSTGLKRSIKELLFNNAIQ